MERFFNFAAASGIALLSLTIQTISQDQNKAPFSIESGTSFSASPISPRSAAKVTPPTATVSAIASDVQEALSIIRRQHADGASLKDAAVIKSSIASMLSELDPHSSYFDAAEFRELLSEQDSEYSGTGSSIANFIRNGQIETYIVSTHPDSAAANAKLQFGDRMIAVDGSPVTGLAAAVIRDRVRGPRGTIVRITVERAISGATETFELRRDRVFQPSVPNFFIIRNGVGYVGLSEGFSHTTSAEFSAALDELQRRGMTSLVLDLRGNTGGVLDQAIKVAETFLPAGSSIISQRGRQGYDDRIWTSENRHSLDLPVVVLVDQQTASASEVVAGALQDNDRALVLGQNTFGKALVQNVLELPTGSGLTLTTARYYTPSGRSIQRSYAGAGKYDYFKHRSAKPGAESRTITNRPVAGGGGITPDEITQPEDFNHVRAALLDPIFFFVRDIIRGMAARAGDGISSSDRVRQSIIFAGEPAVEELLPAFESYALEPGWDVSAVTLAAESDFIEQQLRYQLALATFGPGAAARSRIQTDKQVGRAITALPYAASLAKSAARVRMSAEYKKTRRVAFPTGQGRNRRN